MTEGRVLLANPVLEKARELPKEEVHELLSSLERIGTDPVGEDDLKLDVGDKSGDLYVRQTRNFRILYSIDREKNTILIVHVTRIEPRATEVRKMREWLSGVGNQIDSNESS
jgi:mRNA-degrading endonuclease RelE of RelBE toxin-antitoxin system